MKDLFRKILACLPPRVSIQVRFFYNHRRFVDFRNPKSFCEKIQWLKVYSKNPLYTTLVDKVLVKDFVAKVIGEEYIIPTIAVWDNPSEIDWSLLPQRFVLKTNHAGGSAGVVICKNKDIFNKEEAVVKLWKSYNVNSYSVSKEFPYKNIKRKVFAERYMVPNDKENDQNYDLPDYKFFCFNGEPLYCQVIRNRNSGETIDFYDMEWNHQEFVGLNPSARNGLTPVARPECFEQMKDVCRKLAKSLPFVRVDLYVVDGKMYFGELTFYPASGMGVFYPREWDDKLGEMIKLPCNIMNGEISLQ